LSGERVGNQQKGPVIGERLVAILWTRACDKQRRGKWPFAFGQGHGPRQHNSCCSAAECHFLFDIGKWPRRRLRRRNSKVWSERLKSSGQLSALVCDHLPVIEFWWRSKCLRNAGHRRNFEMKDRILQGHMVGGQPGHSLVQAIERGDQLFLRCRAKCAIEISAASRAFPRRLATGLPTGKIAVAWFSRHAACFATEFQRD